MKKLSVLLFVLVLLAVACLSAPVSPTPAPTATPAQVQGVWLGTTSQGEAITITVQSGAVTSVEFVATVQGEGWSATTDQYRPVAAPISGDRLMVYISDDTWQVEVAGVFVDDMLAGVLWVQHEHPQGFGPASATLGFEAERQ